MHLWNRLAAAATLTATAGLLGACGGPGHPAGPAGPGPAGSAPGTSAPGTSAPAVPGTSAPAATPAPAPFAYLPLFPFSGLAGVRSWQASYAEGGHQPWHLNAAETARAFAASLGFTAITQTAGQTGSQTDAHVAVGYRLPNGKVATAAVVHMVRYGSGRYVPWEVVGTDDTTLTLTTPAYGSTVTSPVTIGGDITGVDENLRAEAYVRGVAAPAGSYCCQPAGGQHQPWSLAMPFHAPAGRVLTIVVHTGGHVAPVERFAVTGVHTR